MRTFFAILTMLLVAQSAAAQQDYRVQAGDVLQVEVLEDPSLNRTALVLPDGQFAFPLIGTMRASGRSLNQIKAAMREGLASNFAVPPTVFVGLASLGVRSTSLGTTATPTMLDIYVLGEVNSPGKTAVEKGTNLLQAFAEVGGFTKFAATKRVQIRRTATNGEQSLFTINYHAIERGAQLRGMPVVQEGDTIIVPQRRLFE